MVNARRHVVFAVVFLAVTAAGSRAEEGGSAPAAPTAQQFQDAQKAAEYLETSRFGEAAREYENLLKSMPDNPSIYYNLGLALYLNGEIDSAINRYRKTIALDPSHAKAHANLAMALEKKGLKDEALESYKTAVRINPQSKTIRLKLAYFYFMQGEYADAVKQYDEALVVDPEYADAHYWKAKALAAMENFADAWKSLHAAEHLGLEVDAAFREEMLKAVPEPARALPKAQAPPVLTQEEVQAFHQKNAEKDRKLQEQP